MFNICLAATIPKKLTNENVLEALKIAYQLELAEEKKSAFHFVWENFEDISIKKEFQQFMVTNPQLMIDFMAKCKGCWIIQPMYFSQLFLHKSYAFKLGYALHKVIPQQISKVLILE